MFIIIIWYVCVVVVVVVVSGRERKRKREKEEVKRKKEKRKKRKKKHSSSHRRLSDQRILVPLELPLSALRRPLHLDRQVVGDEDEAVDWLWSSGGRES